MFLRLSTSLLGISCCSLFLRPWSVPATRCHCCDQLDNIWILFKEIDCFCYLLTSGQLHYINSNYTPITAYQFQFHLKNISSNFRWRCTRLLIVFVCLLRTVHIHHAVIVFKLGQSQYAPPIILTWIDPTTICNKPTKNRSVSVSCGQP